MLALRTIDQRFRTSTDWRRRLVLPIGNIWCYLIYARPNIPVREQISRCQPPLPPAQLIFYFSFALVLPTVGTLRAVPLHQLHQKSTYFVLVLHYVTSSRTARPTASKLYLTIAFSLLYWRRSIGTERSSIGFSTAGKKCEITIA